MDGCRNASCPAHRAAARASAPPSPSSRASVRAARERDWLVRKGSIWAKRLLCSGTQRQPWVPGSGQGPPAAGRATTGSWRPTAVGQVTARDTGPKLAASGTGCKASRGANDGWNGMAFLAHILYPGALSVSWSALSTSPNLHTGRCNARARWLLPGSDLLNL